MASRGRKTKPRSADRQGGGTPDAADDHAPPRPTPSAAQQAPTAARERTAGVVAWIPSRARIEAIARAPWALPAVLGLAVVLRLAHLIAVQNSPFATAVVLDARYYDAWARDIAAGAWIGKAPAWVDPLYAYVLGILYAIFGHHLGLARFLNDVFGIVTIFLVARIAHHVWKSRAIVVVAALMATLCVPTLYFEGQTEKTALTVVLITAAVERFLAGSIVGAGVLTGLATLARGNALLYLPAAAGCLLLGWDREREDPETDTLPERGRRAALFLACALPVIGVATLHNWLASREFVLTTTNLGVNLYLGNHPGNQYGFYERTDFLNPALGDELPDFRAEARRRTGLPLTDKQVSDYWTGQAWGAVKATPGLTVARTLRKLELALHNDELPDNEDVSLVAEWSPVLRLPFFWFGQLVALGALGAVIGWSRRGVRTIAAIIGIYIVGLLPFFVMGRLRVQMAPFLCVLGAGGVLWMVEAVRTVDRRRLLLAGGIIGAVLVATHYRPDWMARKRSSSLAIVWNNLGWTLSSEGRREDAARAFERAIAINDEAVPISLRALGDIYRDRGDYARAETVMRRVLEIKPDSRMGQEALRNLYGVMLADARWRNDPQVRARAQAAGASVAPVPATAVAPADRARSAITQARSFGGQGRWDEAVRVLEDAVKAGPYDEGLHYFLGEVLTRHGTPEEMIRFFSEELAHDEKPQTSHYFWAVGLKRQNNLTGAVEHLRKALEIDPAHEMSQREWGLILEQQGKLKEALDHYVEATKIHPDFKAAFEDAARVATALGRTKEAETFRSGAAKADPNSIRRFVHWARYLHTHGRDEAAWQEIHRMLRERPDDPEALKLRDDIRAKLGPEKAVPIPLPTTPAAAPAPAPTVPAGGGGPPMLSTDARAALVARLASEPSGATWIGYDGRDAGAERLAKELAAAFQEARWTVKDLSPLKIGVRPGMSVMVAGEPSATTRAVDEALVRARIEHVIGSGYRDYSEERRRADPAWRGLDFAPGQEFLIVVGRRQ